VSWPLVIVFAVAGAIATFWTLHLVWRLHGVWRIHRAGPRPLLATRHRIWHDVHSEDVNDLRYGPGGAAYVPDPPFEFVEELLTGTHPSVSVRDRKRRLWRVKWRAEAKPEAFCVRFAAACGYFAEVTHYVPSGIVQDVPPRLSRAASCVDASGAFVNARFELDDPAVMKLFEEHSWSWTDNPFVGTRELAGLRVLLMLLSNWDNKDVRDVKRGSNTAIFRYPAKATESGIAEDRYLITDWGGSMGKWGGYLGREKWDCKGFQSQTKDFVKGVKGDLVQFGYSGQHTDDFKNDIRVSDVQWLLQYLGRVTDAQLRAGLQASGAAPEEVECFTQSLRDRINQLKAVAR